MSKLSEKIKAVDDSSVTLYEIPEWDVTVEIRSITARSRARFFAEISNDDGSVGFNADPDRIEGMWWHVISKTCFDPENGEPVFEDGDKEWLFERNALVINQLAEQCMAVSGLTGDAIDEAGKVSLVSPTDKDGETQNDDSTSG